MTVSQLRTEMRSEIGELKSDFAGRIGGLRSEIGELRSDFAGQIGGLRSEIGELRSDFAGQIGELRSEIGELKSDLERQIAEARSELRLHMDILYEKLRDDIRLFGEAGPRAPENPKARKKPTH